MIDNTDRKTAPLQPLFQRQRIAPVAIEIHIARIQLNNRDCHRMASTSVLIANNLRSRSIAV